MGTLSIAIGQDLSAYATIEVPADTDLSDENLARIAQQAIDDVVFDADWSTAEALRIVTVLDSDRKIVRSDVQIEKSHYGGGVALDTFLRGKSSDLGALINGAIEARMIEPSPMLAYRGCLTTPGGEQLEVEFCAREGATQTEQDIAMFHVLCQKVSVEINVAPDACVDGHNPNPWVVVTNAGTDDEDIVNDFPTFAAALQCADEHGEDADVMKRRDDGSLTTEF